MLKCSLVWSRSVRTGFGEENWTYCSYITIWQTFWLSLFHLAGCWDWKGKQGEVWARQEEWSHQGDSKTFNLSRNVHCHINWDFCYVLLVVAPGHTLTCAIVCAENFLVPGWPCFVLLSGVSPQLWLHSPHTLWRWGSHWRPRHHAGLTFIYLLLFQGA